MYEEAVKVFKALADPKRLAILRAGQMAAGESEYLIASPGFGGSRTITDYALRREKRGLIQMTLLKAP